MHGVPDLAGHLLRLVKTAAQTEDQNKARFCPNFQIVVPDLLGQHQALPQIALRRIALVGVVEFDQPFGQIESRPQRQFRTVELPFERIDPTFVQSHILPAAGNGPIQPAQQRLQVGILFTVRSRSKA